MRNNRYKGMTVNERLWVSGLMSKFDEAVIKQDRNALREILLNVELDDKNIKDIIERVLNTTV